MRSEEPGRSPRSRWKWIHPVSNLCLLGQISRADGQAPCRRGGHHDVAVGVDRKGAEAVVSSLFTTIERIQTSRRLVLFGSSTVDADQDLATTLRYVKANVTVRGI
jgi:hypothetical protein